MIPELFEIQKVACNCTGLTGQQPQLHLTYALNWGMILVTAVLCFSIVVNVFQYVKVKRAVKKIEAKKE